MRNRWLIVLAVAFILTGCGLPGSNGETTTTEDPTAPTEAPVVVTPPTTTPADNGASVYVLKVEGDRAQIVPVWRGVDATPKAAVVELLRGLTTQDTSDALVTALPEFLAVVKLEVQGDLVSVEFKTGLETLSDIDRQAAAAQLVYTLTQFEGISKASILFGTTPIDVPGLGPAVGLTRESFLITGLISNVFIDRPARHEPVVEPGIPVSGRALDVVETNLNYEIQNGAGAVLQNGFITTTGGTGWAPFVDFLELPGTADGELRLVVYAPVEGTPERRFTQTIPVDAG